MKVKNAVSVSDARFTKAPLGEIEFSKFYSSSSLATTFNAGDLIPIYCGEVLPHDTFSVDVDEVIRQATLSVPVMDNAIIDIFAYFVPNRVVNESWKNVMGENASGSWIAPEVSLAPLYDGAAGTITVPVGSLADYYGYPSGFPIPADVLKSCHDLKIRGYLSIFNYYFRDQNYQPPIPFSKLNVCNNFFESTGVNVALDGSGNYSMLIRSAESDGSYPDGAIVKGIYGEGSSISVEGNQAGLIVSPHVNKFSALNKPLKANKLHDYFTSVLPSPFKGREVVLGLNGVVPVITGPSLIYQDGDAQDSFIQSMRWYDKVTGTIFNNNAILTIHQGDTSANSVGEVDSSSLLVPNNLFADLSTGTGMSLSEMRMASGIQQVYEILGRGGSRYTEYINSFFGLDINNPFDDIPTFLGHIRRTLDIYQTAQTAPTEGKPLATLSAFGYTDTQGHLFERTFLEHGYVHILCTVRHKNVYPTLLSRDNFRMNMLDFYQYPLANISEQPVYTREINPYLATANEQVFGYQEAWAELRQEPDRVSALMRPDVPGSLSEWIYVDAMNPYLTIADGDWLQSNTELVINRSTALDSSVLDVPQFKAKFTFNILKERPLPIYSVGGLDIF